MNKWIMLLCAGLLVVMVGCGPKDTAADTETTTEVSKPEDTANKPEDQAAAPSTETKTEETSTETPAPSDMKNPGPPPTAGTENKPEEGKGGPMTPEKPSGEPGTK